jgi:plasmid stabilization system protein ParE
MDRRLHRHPPAISDAVEPAVHLGKDDPAVAERFLDALAATLIELLENPWIGRPRDMERSELTRVRSFLVRGFESHLVFYRPLDSDAGIEVLRVLHGARDLGSLLG